MKTGKWFVLSLTLLLVSLVGVTGTGWAQTATVFGDFSSLSPPGVGPADVAVSGTGDVYIADYYTGNRVLKVAAGQTAATVFGDFSSLDPPDLNGPRAVAVSGTGDVYIVDYYNNRVLKVAAGQTAATVFGDFSSLDPPGIYGANGIAVSGTGDVYITDGRNSRVLKVAAGQTVATVFGDYSSLSPPGLNDPSGVAVSGTGDVYIIDYFNYRVLKVAAGQTAATVFGDFSSVNNGAGLREAFGIAVSGTGDVYITQFYQGQVLKVAAGQTAATVFGDFSSLDPPGMGYPQGIAVSGTGDLYIADGGHGRVLKVGAPVEPRVAVTPNPLDFGAIPTGGHAEGLIHVVNTGNAPLTLGDITNPGDPYFFNPQPDPPGRVLQPGEMEDLHVVFAPHQTDSFFDVFFEVHSNDPVHPVVRAELRGQSFTLATLHFDDAFARPGGHALVEVHLLTNADAAGLQFRIQPFYGPDPTPLAHFNGVINHLESAGFTATATTDPNGVTTVLLFSLSGNVIHSRGDEQLILELVYDIDPGTPNGIAIHLNTYDTLISDPGSHPIPYSWSPEHGWEIHIGRPGDVAGGVLGAGDGRTDILDIIKEIKYILGLLPMPDRYNQDWSIRYRFFVADANDDGDINILDIVGMVNMFLYGNPTKAVADGPTSPVTVSLGELQTLVGGQMAIPVTLRADGTIAGVQATFTFDGAQLQVGTPQLVGRADGMSLQSQLTDGTLHLVVYSATGQGIPAGSGATLLIPVTVLGDPAATPSFTMSQVVLANRQAHAIPVSVGTSTIKVQALPTAFALKPNRPNPFNPTTQLAYEVPQAAHITLAVYNLLGQEVVRLVDGVQAPGRYVVSWNGKNAQGLGVASGVYLYRLTSSTGFTQSRRMTLLK